MDTRAGVPEPPSRNAAIDEAGKAVRDARYTDRDAILEARRVLRDAEKAHDRAVRRAAKRLHDEERDSNGAEKAFAVAHADRQGMNEARPLLERVVGHLDDSEEVLDMVSGISAGHDGVMVVTSRRVLFVAPRRTLDVAYEDVEALKIRGRHFGARATIVARGSKTVISGLSPVRAGEVAELLNERIGRRTLHSR
jgi:hypothetical protein